MSEHDDELVERVAGAIKAAWPGEERMSRAVLDELALELRHDPPEGCEWVALPTEDVDRWCEGWAALVDVPSGRAGSIGVLGQVVDACHGAVARRPKPRTDRVPWWEAVGRRHPLGEVLASVRADESDVRFYGPDGSWICAIDGEDDGKVEVLVEDGAE